MSQVKFAQYLQDIVEKEGVLSKCYSVFYNYSILNQCIASNQFINRGQDVAPIATYKKWQELGRQVKKGAKAIALIMPVTITKKDENGEKTDEYFQSFVMKNGWFSLEDTEGEDFKPEIKIATWDKEKAMKSLNIEEETFQLVDGNAQGYAFNNTIAINPMAILPHKTRFHEMAHVVLGHTLEGELKSDSEKTPKDIREVEAESVAYILCEILGLEGSKESRGYIQGWLKGQAIPEKSAQKIFGAADKILKAGQ